MARVPDFSNSSGSDSIPTTSSWTYQVVSSTPNGSVLPLTSTPTIGRRFKSNVTSGYVIHFSDGTTFLKATAYSRCVARLQSDGACDWRSKSGSTVYRYLGSDSRHNSGITLGTDLHFSHLTGIVRVSSSVVNRALTKAYDKLRQGKLELGVSLAESKRSVTYIASLVKRVLGLYRAFRRGQYEGFGRVYRDLREYRRGTRAMGLTPEASRLWLEYKYGLTPILNDLYGSVELALKGLSTRTGLFSVAATVTSSLPPDDFIQSSSLKRDSVIGGSADESAKVTFWGRVTDPRFSEFSQLGLDNPAEIAWELVPFSFVLDWLVPIGAWLGTLTSTMGVTFVDGHTLKRIRANVQGSPNNPVTGTYVSGARPKGTCRVNAIQREVHLSFPGLLPYVKSPFSTSNIVSAVALLAHSRK